MSDVLEIERGSGNPEPTPATAADQSSSSATGGQEDGSGSTQATERAQVAVAVPDRDQIAWDLLNDEVAPADVRKALADAATPPLRPTTQAEGGRGESKSSAGSSATEGLPAAGEGTTVLTLYDGLAPVQVQALSQTHLLPKPDVWKLFPAEARKALIESAKEILGEKSRLFQSNQALEQARNPKGQFAAKADGEIPTNEAAGTGGTDEDEAPPAAGTAARGAKRAQGQAAAAVASDDPLAGAWANLEDFANRIGDEQSSAPLMAGLRQLHQAQQQALTAKDQQLAYVSQGLLRMEEQAARAELAVEFPHIGASADPAAKAAADEVWKTQVIPGAKIVAAAAHAAQLGWSWQKCVDQAGRTLLATSTKLTAQQNLRTQRHETLRGTPERGATTSHASRGIDPGDRDRLALAELDAQRDKEEVRAMLRG